MARTGRMGRRVRPGVALALLAAVGLAAAGRARAEEESPAKRALAKGHALFTGDRYAEAVAAFHEAATVAEKEGAPRLLVEALAMEARALLAVERAEEGGRVLERVKSLAKEDQPLDWTVYLATRGRFEWKAGRNEEATRTFEAMYEYALAHELYERAVDAAHMVGITGTPDQRVQWGRRGIEAAEKGRMDGWLGPLWNNLAQADEQAGRYAAALDGYQRAREYHWRLGTERHKLIADWAVGHAYRLLGRTREAAAWLRPVVAWAERRYDEDPSHDNAEWLGTASKDLGQVMATAGRDADARALLRRAKELLGAEKMPEWDAAGWKDLVTALERLEAAGAPTAPSPPSGR